MKNYRYTYNRFIFDAIGLAPCTHDKGVVVSNDSDDVNTLCLELWQIVYVARKMVGTAAWGESTWNCEEDDLLSGPFCQVHKVS